MSIRTVQTKYRASSVLSSIDTNSPAGTSKKSTLSPYASPYKPRSIRSSHLHAQNQNEVQFHRRDGRMSFPADSVSTASSGSGGALETILSKIPTYQSSSFDPFGDLTVTELPPSTTTPLRPLSSTAGQGGSRSRTTQQFRSGTGTTHSEPAYTHYYYYDTTTNKPTLAYGVPPASAGYVQPHTSRVNTNNNRSRSPPNNRAVRANGNNINNSQGNSPKAYNPSPRRSNTVVNPPRTPSRSPSPPTSPTSPTEMTFAPSPVSFPVTINVQDPFADPIVAVTPRTRKRSNTISEVKFPSPPSSPPRSPSPPTPTPKKKTTDTSAISKLVAAMLLNRVDVMGRSRCAKRLVNSCGTRYVKSSLSRVAFCEV